MTGSLLSGELTTLLLVAVLTVPAAMASAVTGSGTGVILSILLLPIVGASAVVPVLSIAMLIAHIGRVQAFHSEIDLRSSVQVLAGSVPGCIIGSLTFTRLPETTITLVMAIFLAGLIAFRYFARTPLTQRAVPVVVACSFLYGLLAGTTIGGGILVVPLLMAAGLRGIPLVATDAVVGLAMNFAKAAVFSTAKVLTPDLLFTGVIVGVFTLPGIWIAKRFLKSTPARLHDVLIDAVVAVAALSFLFAYLRDGGYS